MAKRYLLWVVVVVAVFGFSITACGEDEKKESDTPATYTTLNVQEAYDKFSKSDNALIVDVRNPEEWAATGIPPGAALIPLPEIEQRAADELPKDKEIYVICNSGNRSRTASEVLIQQGYTNVINIDGGIQAWLQASLPTEPYTP
jgi:rhodanese-related sulfurtransferase